MCAPSTEIYTRKYFKKALLLGKDKLTMLSSVSTLLFSSLPCSLSPSCSPINQIYNCLDPSTRLEKEQEAAIITSLLLSSTAPRAGNKIIIPGWHTAATTTIMPNAKSSLLILPSEIQLAILDYLGQPKDVLNLGQTCRTFHAIATSDEVWRERVESLVHLHLKQNNTVVDNAVDDSSWLAGNDVYARLVDRLLATGAKYLGERGKNRTFTNLCR
jgi:hypothetical protein